RDRRDEVQALRVQPCGGGFDGLPPALLRLVLRVLREPGAGYLLSTGPAQRPGKSGGEERSPVPGCGEVKLPAGPRFWAGHHRLGYVAAGGALATCGAAAASAFTRAALRAAAAGRAGLPAETEPGHVAAAVHGQVRERHRDSWNRAGQRVARLGVGEGDVRFPLRVLAGRQVSQCAAELLPARH